MVARARETNESYSDYKLNLKMEDKKLKLRLSNIYYAAGAGSRLAKIGKRIMQLFKAQQSAADIAPKVLSSAERGYLRTQRRAQRVARRVQRRT